MLMCAISFLLITVTTPNNNRTVERNISHELSTSDTSPQHTLFSGINLQIHHSVVSAGNRLNLHSLLLKCHGSAALNAHAFSKGTSFLLPHLSHTCTPTPTALKVISFTSYSLIGICVRYASWKIQTGIRSAPTLRVHNPWGSLQSRNEDLSLRLCFLSASPMEKLIRSHIQMTPPAALHLSSLHKSQTLSLRSHSLWPSTPCSLSLTNDHSFPE